MQSTHRRPSAAEDVERGRGVHGAGEWRLWVDTGGTFTDCLAISPGGALRRAKVLSSSQIRTTLDGVDGGRSIRIPVDPALPDEFFRGASVRPAATAEGAREILHHDSRQGRLELSAAWPGLPETGMQIEISCALEAPVLAAHWVTGTPLTAPLPGMRMRLATTRGTNALLERKGAPTVLFITRGFGDLLEIGNQQRPDLFALDVRKRQPLHAEVVEVEERLDSRGKILRPLDLDALRPRIEDVLDKGVVVAAIALMHSYRNPEHERILADHLLREGFQHVTMSAEIAPRIKIVPRAETAVVNAYLSGVIGRYLDAVDAEVDPGPLHVLTSAGSLVRSDAFQPKDSLLSGPAGGVVGAATAAARSGFTRCLAFDMGGTSTDVSRIDGDLDYRFETRVGEVALLSPSLAIETVAAGGGSICHFEGRQLKVGPESAGASPGPACYGAGGPLTLTDVNLLLGRLHPGSFEIPIDVAAADRAAADLEHRVKTERSESQLARDGMLNGLLSIADERMAEAVRRISVRQGYRPSEYALVAFGGAGGQHACAVADILAIETILVPEDAGLLSAVGLGGARVERIAERQVLLPLADAEARLVLLAEELRLEACAAVEAEGVDREDTEVRRTMVYLRLVGQEASLEVDYAPGRPLSASFLDHYQEAYGYRPESPAVEVESVRVIVASRAAGENRIAGPCRRFRLSSSMTRRAFAGGQWREIPVFWRSQIDPGGFRPGPALVFENHCATFVDRGWVLAVDSVGCLVLTRQSAAESVPTETSPNRGPER